MAGHGRPWLTMSSHDWPWPAMIGHGQPWQAVAGFGQMVPVWTDGVSTMLGPHPTAPPVPPLSPLGFYIFKTPNGVAFLRLSFYETFAVLDLPGAQDCGSWAP